jgi:hypothetical protein
VKAQLKLDTLMLSFVEPDWPVVIRGMQLPLILVGAALAVLER